jgi:hypothetical protein
MADRRSSSSNSSRWGWWSRGFFITAVTAARAAADGWTGGDLYIGGACFMVADVSRRMTAGLADRRCGRWHGVGTDIGAYFAGRAEIRRREDRARHQSVERPGRG